MNRNLCLPFARPDPLAALSARNAHTLFARPYLILTPMGLALRNWRVAESSIYRVLGQLFLPFRRIGHVALAWSEFRGCRLEPTDLGLLRYL